MVSLLLAAVGGTAHGQCTPPNLTNVTSDAGLASITIAGSAYQSPSLRPGATLTIQGLCFGTAPGRALIRFYDLDSHPAGNIDLTVVSWTTGQIQARLASGFGGKPNGYGYVRVFNTSNVGNNDSVSYRVVFTPRLEVLILRFDKKLSGGLFGRSTSGTAYSSAPCLDGRISAVENVTRSHSGSGNSSLQSPFANRECLRQGWRMGMRAFRSGTMSIFHHLVVPRGVVPGAASSATAFSVAGPWPGGLPTGQPNITP